LLNGKNTGRLGVTTLEGTRLSVTDIERTLIDIAVRPVYSGGVQEVAHAYEIAEGKFSVNRLVAYFRKLNYTYPYHQIIGYYMDRSQAYSETQLGLLSQFDMDFDFYLTHQMKEIDYVEKWRLFVPKGF